MFLPAVPLLFMVSAAPDLDHLRWHKRVLIVFGPDADDARFKQQIQLLNDVEPQLKARDMEVFEMLDRAPETASLRSKLAIPDDLFALVRVGKDGSVKLRRYEVVQPADIFNLVDSMPMRRAEMDKRS